MTILVDVEYPAPGPPDDPASIITPDGWFHFTTGGADAWLRIPEHAPHRFLLHWIESHAEGHGSALLDAIGRWADREHLTGALVCDPRLIGWYTFHGWEYVGVYGTLANMARWPIAAGRPVIDVHTELL